MMIKHCGTVMLGLWLAACDQAATADDALDRARAAWERAGLGDYDYSVTRHCFCTEDYTRAMRVHVRGGKVQSALYVDDQSAVPPQVLKDLRTIKQWFDRIAEGHQKPFFQMQVSYHPQLGYPQSLEIDVREAVADDEETVAISVLSER